MIRRLIIMLLIGAISLLSAMPMLAQTSSIEFYSTPKEYSAVTGKKIERFNESPMLRTKVASGELPPVEERLPEEPLVVKPLEEIGQYGGTLRRLNEHGTANYQMNFGFEFLAAFAPDMSKVYPNVLKGWKASEDAKKFTLYLRKGMRWSDGVPFTADDIMFWYEDVALNKELSPVPPSRLMAGGEPGVFRKIDNYTIEVSFKVPFGLFIENLCRWRPNPYLPKHYFKQFHPNYTSMDEIKKMMKKEGVASWVLLFQKKLGGHDWFATPERPTIGAWIAQNSPTELLQVMTRNPYYWKVDTEGNQLPYIDKITRLLIMDPEAMLLKTIAGEVDMQNKAYFGGLVDYPLIMENREKGNYHLVQTWWPPNNLGAVFFNYSSKDPILKKIFRNKNFRIALSVALDREAMNNLFFKGLAVPSHPTCASGPPFYGEKLSKNYLQYDPQLANQLLDEMGLDKRDKEGYRLRADGKRLRITNTVRTLREVEIDLAEEYRKYWKAIGIEVVNRPQPMGVLQALFDSGNYDLITSSMTWGGRPMNPLYRMGEDCLYYNIVPQWRIWINSKGKKGEEPPEVVKQMIKIRNEAITEPDEAKRIAATLQIFKTLEENLWVIGGLNESKRGNFIVVQNRMRNVPDYMCAEWLYSIPAQYYIKE